MESKITATHRLQKEGRWNEACAFRDEVRRQRKAEGGTKDEANEAAWEAMIERYPPIESPVEAVVEEEELLDLPLELLGQPTDLGRDILWTYEHLSCKSPPTEGIPSAGALGLWRWAKSNSDRFYEQLLPKALKERPPETHTGVVEDPGIEEIKRMLRDLGEDDKDGLSEIGV